VGDRPAAVSWLAVGEDALPAGTGWLAPTEAARAVALHSTKRRTEYLLRRLVAKHAVAAVTGQSANPTALARIEVRNAASGAPEVVVDGVPLLVHTTVLDGTDPALCGPAGTAGARAVGTLVCAGAAAGPIAGAGETAEVRWAWTALEGPGAVLLAVGTPSAVAAALDGAADALLDGGPPATPAPVVMV